MSIGDPPRDIPLHRRDVVIAIICRDGRALICRRPYSVAFGGYWEFPGGKREPNESLVECLRREIREELSVEIKPLGPLAPIDHDYPGGAIRLHPFLCELVEGHPRPLASQSLEWVSPQDLSAYRFPPANDRLLREVASRLTVASHSAAPAPTDR